MRAVGSLALAILVSGCGAERVEPATPAPAGLSPGAGEEGLKTLATAYLDFQQAKGRPPKTFAELGGHSLDISRPLPPSVQSLTVVWGAGMGPLCRDAKPDEVIVANARLAGDSIPVLTADGVTRTMTIKEFEGAKKATPLE